MRQGAGHGRSNAASVESSDVREQDVAGAACSGGGRLALGWGGVGAARAMYVVDEAAWDGWRGEAPVAVGGWSGGGAQPVCLGVWAVREANFTQVPYLMRKHHPEPRSQRAGLSHRQACRRPGLSRPRSVPSCRQRPLAASAGRGQLRSTSSEHVALLAADKGTTRASWRL